MNDIIHPVEFFVLAALLIAMFLFKKPKSSSGRASDNGDMELYRGLICVKREEYHQAELFFKLAIAKDNTEAMCELASIYLNDFLRDGEDRGLAGMALLTRAAQIGNVRALKVCGALDLKREQEKVNEWHEKLEAEQVELTVEESGGVLEELVSLYPDGSSPSPEEISNIYARASVRKYNSKAIEGNSIAMLALAKAYRIGSGVEVSFIKSYLWGKLALLRGIDEAAQLVKDLEGFLLKSDEKLLVGEVFEVFAANYQNCDIDSIIHKKVSPSVPDNPDP
ncbi:MAG: hypothetical protein AB7P76_07060 [Candidatus Melainabacteria bacterium]